jgi:hypothetical protein
MTHTIRLGFVLLLAGLAASAATAQNINMSTRLLDEGAGDCSAIEVTSNEFTVAMSEELLTPPPGHLSVRAPQSGGVWIAGSSAGAFEVRACKFALGTDQGDADARLQQIRVSTGDRITAEGPDRGRWLVYFLVQVPRGSSLEAETTNGPISIRGVDGSVTGRAVNGPISVTESRGKIDVETVNGPISLTRSSGDVRLSAQNGPVTVTLEGSEWEGAGLRGGTRNGPLTVSIPEGYRSGVVVEADGRSPFRCDQCPDTRRSGDGESRRVEIGSGPERVRLTTVNGPVTVKR